MTSEIAIVDYGIGNLKSIQNMIKKIGGKAIITNDEAALRRASKLILPGVGAFDQGMITLNKSGLVTLLNELVLEKKTPILGICLGAQIMTKGSEEGELKGLGWFDATTIKFNLSEDSDLKIPHMGWNEIHIKKDIPLMEGLDNESRFYFVHSFHFMANDISDVLCTSNHGYQFASGLQQDHIFALQYHPEKSHKYGMQLMKNFVNL